MVSDLVFLFAERVKIYILATTKNRGSKPVACCSMGKSCYDVL